MPAHSKLENWCPIAGYEGSYEVSDCGRIRSFDRVVLCATRWGTGKRKLRGQFISPANIKGYRVVRLSCDGIGHQFKVHRLMGIAFLPNPRNLPDINHKDGKKSRNVLNNIEWSSKGDNTRHSRQVLKCCCAEKNGRAKLSKRKVAALRKARREGQSYGQLMKKFPVGKSQIARIIRAVHWAA